MSSIWAKRSQKRNISQHATRIKVYSCRINESRSSNVHTSEFLHQHLASILPLDVAFGALLVEVRVLQGQSV